jgi:arylsulfatase A-like enzyme
MAIYAAMIDAIDQSVGRMVEGLKERGMLENTLILFMTDNGGNAEGGPQGITRGEPLGGPDSHVFLGMNWATLNNTPLRSYKHFTLEGGITSPLIAHWPAGMKAGAAGSIDHTPTHLIDIMATAVDITGAPYPSVFKGHRILPMEGQSLRPLLSQPSAHLPNRLPPRQLFWMHEGNRALRSGPWKLVMKFKGPWELYHIDKDRTEQHNVIGKFPELSQHLIDQWEAWAETTFVDEWIGEARTDWGEEIRPAGNPKAKGKGKKK